MTLYWQKCDSCHFTPADFARLITRTACFSWKWETIEWSPVYPVTPHLVSFLKTIWNPRKEAWLTLNRSENRHKNVRLPIAYHVIGRPEYVVQSELPIDPYPLIGLFFCSLDDFCFKKMDFFDSWNYYRTYWLNKSIKSIQQVTYIEARIFNKTCLIFLFRTQICKCFP